MTPGSSERRSRFRTKRISLKPCQVCAYYGLCESDEEGEEIRIAPTTKQNRDSDQTTFVAPSFRCSLPVSDFQSPVSEDASFDNQTESLEKDIVKHTKAKQNRDSDQTTFVAPSFRCSLPVSDFQTTATQTENLEDDLTDRTKAKQNRDSDQTTFVAPSFRCSLPVSDFQSPVSEDASFDTQIEKLENDIVDRTKAKQNRDSDQATFVVPSFRCSLPVSHFQSTVCEDTSFDTQTESLESDIVERSKAKQNRGSDQTTFVAPSYRCSLPVSHFQSTVCEDAFQTENLESDIVERTKAKQNRDTDLMTFVAPSFRCSLPASHFQTTATQTENLEDDLTDRTKAKQNRDSNQTTFVAPSFRCSLPVSHFQSTICEDASFDTQTESLENDIMERSKKYSVLSRTDGFSSPTQKENEEAQLPMNDDVIISDVESPPRQGNMARYSIIVPPPYRPGPVDTKAQPKPWRMEAKTLSICPRIPRRTNEHSAEQRNSFDKLQPTECAARNSIVSPVRTTKRQFERKIASPLDNETIANSKPKDSLREIQLNYITPTLAPRRRKSVFFSEYNTTYVYSDDKQGHFHISGTDSFEYAKSGKVDEIVNHSLAEDVENIRLGENSINNLSGSLGPMMMESLMDSTVLMDSDETNINESIVFGWQKKDGKTDKEEVPKIDCNQPGTSKQSQQFNILADSSMWDAGGVDDPSFYDNTVQFNDIEPSILDDSLPLTQQSRRCPEWPTIVDNSLGMSNSPASSNGHESYTVFGSQADSDNAFGAQMDSTILYGSQLESDDSLDSPKIKHIVIRASPKKKPLKYVLAAPKIQRNNPDSPTVVEDGLRRSKRNRIQTLDPGHLQKPIYERDAYGNETLVGVETCTVHNKLLTKHKTADPKTAFEMERQMQHRKKLEREKKKEVKELLSKNYSRYK